MNKIIILVVAAVLSIMSFQPSFAVPADFYVMDVTPDTMEPGTTATLSITLKNLAPNHAAFVSATLDPEDNSPIDVIGVPRVYLERVGEAQEAEGIFFGVIQNEELRIEMPILVEHGTAENVYNVPLVMKWKNELLEDVTQTINIGIHVEGKPLVGVAKVTTNPLELRPDSEKNEIVITVENAGKTTAKSVKIELGTDDLFIESYSGSTLDFYQEILPGTSQDFVLTLDVERDATPGIYSLPIEISYRTEESLHEISEEINLRINTEAEFKILETVTNPAIIAPGDSFIVNVPIKNVGHEDAEAVKAVIKTKSFFTGVKTDYLGNIDVGDEKLASFELKVDRDTLPDSYNSDLTLIWKEGKDVYEEVYSTSYTVHSNEIKGETDYGWLVYGAIFVGALLFLGYSGLRIRKRGSEAVD